MVCSCRSDMPRRMAPGTWTGQRLCSPCILKGQISTIKRKPRGGRTSVIFYWYLWVLISIYFRMQFPMLMLNNVDWSFLRGYRGSSCHFYYGPSVESTAILNGLYRKCSVFTRQHHYNSTHHSPRTSRLTQSLYPGIFNMGQRTLVLELGYQSYQRPAGGLYPSMGVFVPSGYSATGEPAGPCQNSYILCRRPREVSHFIDGQNSAHAHPHLSPSLLCRASHMVD